MKYNKLLILGILLVVFGIFTYAQPSSDNSPPTANAGVDRNVVVGEEATLFGSGIDSDGDSLTYKWQLIEFPGSPVEITNDDEHSPTFTPDVTGEFEFSLRISDGKSSDTSNVIITAIEKIEGNKKPIPFAGSDRDVNIDEESILAGFGLDEDKDDLIYIWVLMTKPDGSNVQFTSMGGQSAPFIPDVADEYTFKLIVLDDKGESASDVVIITASTSDSNRVPSADAGPPKTIKTGEETTLSGNGIDPDKKFFVFSWSVVKPEGSDNIFRSNNDIPNMTFTPDIDGDYVFSLIIDDGIEISEPSTITYTAVDSSENERPTADAGSDIDDAKTGEKVNLVGDGIDEDDADKEKLNFRWSIVERPAASGTSLSNPNEQNPFFIPDAVGSYTIQLITNDGKEDSLPDKVVVKVIGAPVECTEGTCFLGTQEWCSGGKKVKGGYCDQCASKDSTCTSCKPNACDRDNKRWCGSDKKWSVNDFADYCNVNKCGNVDSSCSICSGDVCDTVDKKWCEGTEWKSGSNSEYCIQCGQKDNTCPICEENACDTDNQNWCDNGVWSKLGNYCDKCGDVDESCGQECVEGTCDTTNRKFCENKVWEEANYCLECGSVDSSCSVECTKNTCDTKNRQFCATVDKKGVWTNEDYCSLKKCGERDVSCGNACEIFLNKPVCDTTANARCNLVFWVGKESFYCAKCDDTLCAKTCTNNACDIEAGQWCDNGDWKNVGYCEKCGNLDSSCSSTCEENACDITSDEVCIDGKWKPNNYCDNCGLKDSDCTLFCAEGECDTKNKKVCKSGLWTGESYSTLCEVAPSKESCNKDGNCTIDSYCTKGSECASEFCYSDKCTEPSCDDGKRNGNETDIDCGGERCDRCSIGDTCKINLDCSSSLCESRTCKRINLCKDGIKSGGETDVDCGGSCRDKCELARGCNTDEDCVSGLVCTSHICTITRPGSGLIPIDERERRIPEIPYEERDSDNDGIPDMWEEQNGLDPNDPSDSSEDYDQDGLINLQEFTYGTDPNIADSDGDGASDKEEIDKGTDPLELEDKPGVGLGLLIMIIVLLVIFGLGGYGAFYYVSRHMSQRSVNINEQEPGFMPSYIPQKQNVRKPLVKPKVERVVEERRMEKEKKRGKLLEAFGKKSLKSKEEKSLVSMAKEKQEIEKIMPGKTKEDVFSKLKLISKKEKEEKK